MMLLIYSADRDLIKGNALYKRYFDVAKDNNVHTDFSKKIHFVIMDLLFGVDRSQHMF